MAAERRALQSKFDEIKNFSQKGLKNSEKAEHS
jgi:hypothetical protein